MSCEHELLSISDTLNLFAALKQADGDGHGMFPGNVEAQPSAFQAGRQEHYSPPPSLFSGSPSTPKLERGDIASIASNSLPKSSCSTRQQKISCTTAASSLQAVQDFRQEQQSTQNQVDVQPIVPFMSHLAEDTQTLGITWSGTACPDIVSEAPNSQFIEDALSLMFERRAPSVYNTIKYKLAKAILDEWFRPHYLLPEDCKLNPLQLATGQAGQVVHNAWQELSSGCVPQPKFKDIILNEPLFDLETTDCMPNVTSLNLNWLLSQALRARPSQFTNCLHSLVQMSFGCSRLEDDISTASKRHLAEYIVSLESTASHCSMPETPFGVRCTTAGALLKTTIGRCGKRGAKSSPSVSQLATDDLRFRVSMSMMHQSEKIIQLDWVTVIFGSAAMQCHGNDSYQMHASGLPCRSFEEEFQYEIGIGGTTPAERSRAWPADWCQARQPPMCAAQMAQRDIGSAIVDSLHASDNVKNFPYKEAVLTQQQREKTSWDHLPMRGIYSIPDESMGCWPKLSTSMNDSIAPPNNARVVTSGDQCIAAIRGLEGRPKISVACELGNAGADIHKADACESSAISLIVIWGPALKAASQNAVSVLIDLQSASPSEKLRMMRAVKPVMEDPAVVKVIIQIILELVFIFGA